MLSQRTLFCSVVIALMSLASVSESLAQRASMRGGFRHLRPTRTIAPVGNYASLPARQLVANPVFHQPIRPAASNVVNPTLGQSALGQSAFVPVQAIEQLMVPSGVSEGEDAPLSQDISNKKEAVAPVRAKVAPASDSQKPTIVDSLDLDGPSENLAENANKENVPTKSTDKKSESIDPEDPANDLKPGMLVKGGGKIISVGKPGENLDSEKNAAATVVDEAKSNSVKASDVLPAASEPKASQPKSDTSGQSILVQ